ncbi:MAG: hypothetical protein DME24_25880 [Verrucomicrobia bacterium]|nr:MAG: hypothetical protein DME24_25880 [Verrucomicrobiota bacterium]
MVVNDSTGSNAVITAAISAEGMVTNLSVQNAGGGYSTSATLTIAPPPSNAYQVFASTNHFNGVNLLTNVNNVVVGSFAGNGGGLTGVNAATLEGLGAGSFWQSGGNSGTTPGVNFLGTTDNQPLELNVQGQRALRVEPATNSARGYAPNIIGGYVSNSVAPGVIGATIAGGGRFDVFGENLSHRITAHHGTIGGGDRNTVNGEDGTIAGGGGNTVSGGYSFIGGGLFNTIQTGANYATIGGGSGNTIQTGADYGTISGGWGNASSGPYATLGGGDRNISSGNIATVGGGSLNTSSGNYSTVGGGAGNRASGYVATVGGGQGNTSSGQDAIVPGGFNNNAAGDYSFAAGNQAKANHQGAFVWADSTSADFASTAMNQFLIRAAGGVGIGTNSPATQLHVLSAKQTVAIIDGSSIGGTWLGLGNSSTGGQRWSIISSGSGNGEGAGRLIFFTSQGNSRKMMLDGAGNLTINGTLAQGSDRNIKTAFEPVDAGAVLEQVTKLPVMKWAYTNDASVRHLGPMAQDFYASFGVGADDQHIADIDESGVALAAIQGLNQKLEERLQQKETEITELKRTVNELKELVQAINHKLNIEVR